MIKFWSILIAILLLVTSGVLYVTKDKISQTAGEAQPAEEKNETIIAGEAQIGGSFNLINQDGKEVTDKDYRGKIMMVFFGFTSCPDMCIIGAQTYAKTLELLGDKAVDVAPLFISVDPEHDTPEVMKKYFAGIDSRVIGLTGTHAQVKQAASSYKAYFAKTKLEDGTDTVDHSGYIYILDKNGVYIQNYGFDSPPQDIANYILSVLE